MTKLALFLHVIAGTIALFAGIVAMSSRKGAGSHRVAGTVFFISMLVMAVFADYLAVAIPEQIPNLFIGTFTIYLVATAWLTVRRKGSVGIPEKIALLVILSLCVPFAILSFQLATGLEPAFKSATPLEGPVRVAIYSFTFLVAMAAIGDVRLVRAGGVTGVRRIGRHLWRMCLGLTFAAGSAFTNGLPRLLPKTVQCSTNPLVHSSIVLAGIANLLDDPRPVYGLVQRLCAELNRTSCLADSASGRNHW